MQNSVREITASANPVSFISRLFNIAPSQWPRVAECWFITFFFKVGAAIGATVLTSAFIARFGIGYLPILFIVSALLIILSTTLFEELIMKIKREILMMSMLFTASLMIFSATFFYESSPILFFALTICAEALFLAQFNIFLPILVGDRFTPLESQSTFPFIESGETIGGIAGASLLAFFGAKLPVAWFMYIWMAVLICAMLVFIITSFVRTSLPALKLHSQDRNSNTPRREMKEVIGAVRKIPFLQSLVIVVLLQWVFMNLLDIQFTKSVEQSIATPVNKSVSAEQSLPNYFGASVLNADQIEASIKPDMERKLTVEQEAQLSEKLGQIRSSFHAASLFVQALIATRLISSLGVIGSMLLHPIIMLLSLVGMFFKFGLTSSTITRMNFEVTNVVYKNAYFTSHYALPKNIRDQAAEFLEGIARPIGTVVSMSLILAFQYFSSGAQLSNAIHVVMFFIMFSVLFITLKLQTKYTDITRQQLFSNRPYPEKLNAIEILAQKGHRDAPAILVQKLIDPNAVEDSPIVRIKLLSALGEFSDYSTLPEILDALSDNEPSVRLEAAHVLINFKNVGDKFYSQAFSKYRMCEALKETFKKEKFQSVRSAIIRVFSILRQSEIVPFLLDQLKKEDPKARADSVHTLGMFHDLNAAYYILPSLNDETERVRNAAMIALWQFDKYRPMLENTLIDMLNNESREDLFSALYIMGEVKYHKTELLLPYLQNNDNEVALEAGFALTKCGVARGFLPVLSHLLELPFEKFESTRLFINRLNENARTMVERVVIHLISHEINALMHLKNVTSFDQIDTNTLEKLRRYYALIGQYEELFEFECALRDRQINYANNQ